MSLPLGRHRQDQNPLVDKIPGLVASGLAPYLPFGDFVVMDSTRFLGEAVAHVFAGIGDAPQLFDEPRQIDIGLIRHRRCAACLDQMRRRRQTPNFRRIAMGAVDQMLQSLGVKSLHRSEPAFEAMPGGTDEVENNHGEIGRQYIKQGRCAAVRANSDRGKGGPESNNGPRGPVIAE